MGAIQQDATDVCGTSCCPKLPYWIRHWSRLKYLHLHSLPPTLLILRKVRVYHTNFVPLKFSSKLGTCVELGPHIHDACVVSNACSLTCITPPFVRLIETYWRRDTPWNSWRESYCLPYWETINGIGRVKYIGAKALLINISD